MRFVKFRKTQIKNSPENTNVALDSWDIIFSTHAKNLAFVFRHRAKKIEEFFFNVTLSTQNKSCLKRPKFWLLAVLRAEFEIQKSAHKLSIFERYHHRTKIWRTKVASIMLRVWQFKLITKVFLFKFRSSQTGLINVQPLILNFLVFNLRNRSNKCSALKQKFFGSNFGPLKQD